jgi:hypothetical protein
LTTDLMLALRSVPASNDFLPETVSVANLSDPRVSEAAAAEPDRPPGSDSGQAGGARPYHRAPPKSGFGLPEGVVGPTVHRSTSRGAVGGCSASAPILANAPREASIPGGSRWSLSTSMADEAAWDWASNPAEPPLWRPGRWPVSGQAHHSPGASAYDLLEMLKSPYHVVF